MGYGDCMFDVRKKILMKLGFFWTEVSSSEGSSWIAYLRALPKKSAKSLIIFGSKSKTNYKILLLALEKNSNKIRLVTYTAFFSNMSDSSYQISKFFTRSRKIFLNTVSMVGNNTIHQKFLWTHVMEFRQKCQKFFAKKLNFFGRKSENFWFKMQKNSWD